MIERIAKYLAVYGLSMVRPSLSPMVAYASGLHVAESILLCALGIASSVMIVATVGERVRELIAQRRARKGKPEKPRREINPRVRAVWNRYGAAGIAFITPLLLSPPGGGMAAAAFGVPRPRLVVHIAWAGLFWGTVYTLLWYFFADALGFTRR